MGKDNYSEPIAEKGWEEKIWKKFLEDVENAEHKHKAAQFLDGILTASEKKFISKRLAALSLIKSGKSYTEIGKILWISPSTVSGLKKSIFDASYQSNRDRSANGKNERSKKIQELPSSTILDYWANLPLPSKTIKKRRR